MYYLSINCKKTKRFKGFVSGKSPKEVYEKSEALGDYYGYVFWATETGKGIKYDVDELWKKIDCGANL